MVLLLRNTSDLLVDLPQWNAGREIYFLIGHSQLARLRVYLIQKPYRGFELHPRLAPSRYLLPLLAA